jgi:hypothetical protein
MLAGGSPALRAGVALAQATAVQHGVTV